MPNFFGKHQKRSYFEGWYFRNQNETEVISLIPAIHIDDKGQKSASIQVIMNTASDNITYPFDDFAVLAKKPGIRIGKNIFTRDGIILNICTERTTIIIVSHGADYYVKSSSDLLKNSSISSLDFGLQNKYP